MKFNLSVLVIFAVCAGVFGVLFAGCKRAPTQIKVGDGPGSAVEIDPFKSAFESFRTPENVAIGDDIVRFRDGVQTLTAHFNTAEVIKQIQLDAEERKFLEKNAHLTEAELAEIEGTSFRNHDAHYLDECYLLRDVAESIKVPGASPVDQAHYQFRWVMRNVLLHEQADDWMPPAFTLRRGYGGSLERALVFLALLRQSRLEGCLISAASPEPRQFLVGVLDSKTSSVYLFDPRLGLAVLSKDGKHVATLKEAIDDPALLGPSGVTPKQAKDLKAWLCCPLFALSPRMRVLEEGLTQHEPITLHLKASALAQEITKATQLPTEVWNPINESKTLPNSPTRCLWMFLPRTEGGLDDGRRAASFVRARLPFDNVLLNLGRISVNQEQMLKKEAWGRLLAINADLLDKYELQPREMLLRGQRAPMLRRQERIEPFIKMDVALAPDEVETWLDQVRTAYSRLDSEDPKQRALAPQAVAALWGQDLFVGRLIDVDREDEFDRKNQNQILEKRTVLTKVLAFGTREHLRSEIARSQASANQEAAERAQVLMQPATRKLAEEAWDVAHTGWSNFYLGRISLQAKIDQGRLQIQQRVPPGPQGVEMKCNLLENLHLEVHKYFGAKLRVAECKVYADPEGAKAAAAYLESARQEIEAIERKGVLKADIDDLGQLLPQFKEPYRAVFQKRLDLLSNSWSDQGHYYWMKQHIDRRVAALRQ